MLLYLYTVYTLTDWLAALPWLPALRTVVQFPLYPVLFPLWASSSPYSPVLFPPQAFRFSNTTVPQPSRASTSAYNPVPLPSWWQKKWKMTKLARGPASLSWLLTEVILSRTEEFYNLLKGKKLVKMMIRPRY